MYYVSRIQHTVERRQFVWMTQSYTYLYLLTYTDTILILYNIQCVCHKLTIKFDYNLDLLMRLLARTSSAN